MSNITEISIVCPLFNKEDYIGETIESLLAQDYKNWELLIIDDGSTDKSITVVNKYLTLDSRLKLIIRSDFTDSRGGGVCRNLGVKMAVGDYLMFLDADDLIDRTALKDRVDQIKRNPNANMLIFNHLFFIHNVNNAFRKEDLILKFLHRLSFYKKSFFLRQFLKYNLPWTISNPIWKRSWLIELGGFDESLKRLQDPQLHVRALLHEGTQIADFRFSNFGNVLIRLDDERHAGSIGGKLEKFELYYQSVIQFVELIKAELIEARKPHYIRYLKGYFFTLLANINYESLNADSTFISYLEVKKNDIKIKANEIFGNTNSVNFYVNLHKRLLNIPLSRKLKIPAVLYKFYLNVVIF